MKKLHCILLIDDNEDDNYFHTLIIREANAADHVKIAITAEKALEYLEMSRGNSIQYPVPDLIFLDINMPGANGFEFLEKAGERKLIKESKPIVVVMLTSSLNPNDAKMANEKFSQEIKEFKIKPLTGEMLEEIVEKYF